MKFRAVRCRFARTVWGMLLCLALSEAFAAPAANDGSSPDDAERLARRIDELVAGHWQEAGVIPAPLSDDAEFFRRVSLDICGKIPSGSAVRDFLHDDSPDKRRRAVEEFLKSPAYLVNYTNLWRAAMIPEADAEPELRLILPGFEAWLRSRIAENRNFAEIVEEILTLPVGAEDLAGFSTPDRPTPAAFYRAKDGKPELLAAATARLFLGMRIDCAQCHDHPFDTWKREQFWEHAAFFTNLTPGAPVVDQALKIVQGNARISIPETDRTVQARFLDGRLPDWSSGKESRVQLAQWMVSPENPYFARAAVNRIWSYHFGIGLVEPMDDFSSSNPPSHPELLQELAREFVSHGYDFKFLIRAITSSRTYQLTSSQTDESQSRPRMFARMTVRGMTPEQIFDSLAEATGYRQPFDPEQPLNFNNDTRRQEFIATFSNQTESAPDRSSTILQALQLMNGQFVSDATNLTDSRTLAGVIDAPFLNLQEKVEALYLATLSRVPSEAERNYVQEFLKQPGQRRDLPSGLADLFWALLNSSEFLLNH